MWESSTGVQIAATTATLMVFGLQSYPLLCQLKICYCLHNGSSFADQWSYHQFIEFSIARSNILMQTITF
jgi:hypothetical protein